MIIWPLAIFVQPIIWRPNHTTWSHDLVTRPYLITRHLRWYHNTLHSLDIDHMTIWCIALMTNIAHTTAATSDNHVTCTAHTAHIGRIGILLDSIISYRFSLEFYCILLLCNLGGWRCVYKPRLSTSDRLFLSFLFTLTIWLFPWCYLWNFLVFSILSCLPRLVWRTCSVALLVFMERYSRCL